MTTTTKLLLLVLFFSLAANVGQWERARRNAPGRYQSGEITFPKLGTIGFTAFDTQTGKMHVQYCIMGQLGRSEVVDLVGPPQPNVFEQIAAEDER